MNSQALLLQFKSIHKNKGVLFLGYYILVSLHNKYIKTYIFGSHSQKGEDLVIEKILKKKKGFYVDVGAHNPTVFSNTKRFYDKGWRGVNIEPNPLLYRVFEKVRTRDVNLNIGIGRNSGEFLFYEMEPDSLSTFSKKEKDAKVKVGYVLKKTYKIKVRTLKSILFQYKDKKIDFISIDTEGLDMEVLQSNDWDRFRPTLVCIETGDFQEMVTGKESGKNATIKKFMETNNYKEVYANGLNSIFQDIR